MMQMFTETKGYATREMAVKKVEAAIAKFNEGCRREVPVRYMIVSNEAGRFLPVIMHDNPDFIWFVHANPNIAIAK